MADEKPKPPGAIDQTFAETGQDATTKPDEKPEDPRLGLPPNVQVETVKGATPLELVKPGAKGPWIIYTGIAGLRIMDAAAWKSANVDSKSYHQWNYMNGKRLPRANFSDEELQYLLNVDGRFIIRTDEELAEEAAAKKAEAEVE